MIDKIFELLKPFIIWQYHKLLFKYDERYKAIFSEMDNIFDDNFYILKNNIKKYIENNKELQKEFKKLPNNIKSDLIKNINIWPEFFNDDGNLLNIIEHNNIFKIFILPYFKNNKKFVSSLNNFEDSILWFRKAYFIELDNFYNWVQVNYKILDTHKKIIRKNINKLLENFENIIPIITIWLYKTFYYFLITSSSISSKQLKNIHKTMNTVFEKVTNKENFKIYIYLEDYIENSLTGFINLISKKDV